MMHHGAPSALPLPLPPQNRAGHQPPLDPGLAGAALSAARLRLPTELSRS